MSGLGGEAEGNVQLPIYVLIPVYNGGRTLRRTLNNLNNQTFQDFRLLIYDDGSTDETRQILSQFAARDARITVIRGERNLGRGAARNVLLNAAPDALVAWQDADDTWAPTKLAEQIAFFHRLPSSGIDPARSIILSSFTKLAWRRGENHVSAHVPPERYDAAYVFGNDYPKCPFQLQATLGPAAVYLDCGGFDDALNWSEDIDMALRILSHGYAIVPHRASEGLAVYHQSLARVDGDLVSRAQQVLIERYREFARRHDVDIDDLFARRRLSYLFSIYLARGAYSRAISTTLASVLETDEEKLDLISHNLVAVFRELLRDHDAEREKTD